MDAQMAYQSPMYIRIVLCLGCAVVLMILWKEKTRICYIPREEYNVQKQKMMLSSDTSDKGLDFHSGELDQLGQLAQSGQSTTLRNVDEEVEYTVNPRPNRCTSEVYRSNAVTERDGPTRGGKPVQETQ